MAIKHTSISYYGWNYVEHARQDFMEMKEHGCDTVILAITEFDMDFWFPNLNNIIKEAHKQGLRAIADLWGIGKFFGGEQVSLFLQNNINHRQVSAMTGESLPAVCFTSNAFRDYFNGLCVKIARETEIDGFFWDEPHYALPNAQLHGDGHDWTCRCSECMKKFADYYGYEMPKIINDDVKSFRWKEALFTLADASRRIKEVNPNLEITCCVHATLDNYYLPEYRGYDKWDDVASCPYFDVFSSTIIDWDSSDEFILDIAQRTVNMAKKYNKESERWLFGYYTRFNNYKRMDEVVDMYEKLGVDRLATWTYRGGYGTTLSAKDPITLWDNIGRNYKRVLKK